MWYISKHCYHYLTAPCLVNGSPFTLALGSFLVITSVVWESSMCLGMTSSPKLIFCIFGSRPRIGYFSKESWFLLVGVGIYGLQCVFYMSNFFNLFPHGLEELTRDWICWNLGLRPMLFFESPMYVSSSGGSWGKRELCLLTSSRKWHLYHLLKHLSDFIASFNKYSVIACCIYCFRPQGHPKACCHGDDILVRGRKTTDKHTCDRVWGLLFYRGWSDKH